jgi:hypothetical protein
MSRRKFSTSVSGARGFVSANGRVPQADRSGVTRAQTRPSPFAAWIEQLAAEGITGGCGGGNFCPASPNTRGQMAVFLTKTFDLP